MINLVDVFGQALLLWTLGHAPQARRIIKNYHAKLMHVGESCRLVSLPPKKHMANTKQNMTHGTWVGESISC